MYLAPPTLYIFIYQSNYDKHTNEKPVKLSESWARYTTSYKLILTPASIFGHCLYEYLQNTYKCVLGNWRNV
jgi:hypothetical protein